MTLEKIEIKLYNNDKRVYTVDESDKNLFLIEFKKIKVQPKLKTVKAITSQTYIIYFENNKYEINGFYLKNELKNKCYNFEFISNTISPLISEIEDKIIK